jgi:hypothetical protein
MVFPYTGVIMVPLRKVDVGITSEDASPYVQTRPRPLAIADLEPTPSLSTAADGAVGKTNGGFAPVVEVESGLPVSSVRTFR